MRVLHMLSFLSFFFMGAVLTACGGHFLGGNDVSHHTAATQKQIFVDVSKQKIDVFDGSTWVRTFKVSTGKPSTPTDIGTHRIYEKREYDRYPTVDNGARYRYFSMYFNRGEAFHFAWWHNNFGKRAMSLGCVNMRERDAQWLFDFAPVGTKVVVHRGDVRLPSDPEPVRPPAPTPPPSQPIRQGDCVVDAPWGETALFSEPNWNSQLSQTLSNGTRIRVDVNGSTTGFARVDLSQNGHLSVGLSTFWLNRQVLDCR